MEELMDFDEWLANYTPQEPEYVAVFEPLTGAVKSVGPSHAFENEPNKIPVDRELAEAIIAGTIKIGSCIIDPSSNSLEISEVKNVFKIDDVLHRIISKEYSDVEKHDLYVIYDTVDKTLIIELSEEYGGTKRLPDKFQPVKAKKVIWDGDTEMDFLITEYNDPNILFKMVSVKINSLIGNYVVFQNIDYDNFSVYTRRLFKNCVIEYK
jgi:hypothetical protein